MHQRSLYLLPVTAAFLFAGSFVVGRVATKSYDPVLIAVLRNIFALLFLVVLRSQTGGSVAKQFSPGYAILVVLCGIFGVVGYLYCFLRAIAATSATNAAIINSFIPAFTACLGITVLKEKFSTRVYLGFILSLVGVMVLVLSSETSTFRFKFGNGEIWMLLAVMCSGVHAVSTKAASSYYSSREITLWSIGVGLFFLLMIALFRDLLGQIAAIDTPGWLSILYMGVGASGIGGLLFNISIRKLGATLTAGYVYALVPIFVTLLATCFERSQLTSAAVGSYLLVLSGIGLTFGASSRSSGLGERFK